MSDALDLETLFLDERLQREASELGDNGGGKKSQADMLVRIARADDRAELFHTSDHEAYVQFTVEGHHETWRVRSREYRRLLASRFFATEKTAPNAEAIKAALEVLEGHALFTGPELEVFVRVAEHEGDIYVDLADPEWRAVRLGPRGWQIVDHPPVRFRRARGMRPLPLPRRDGDVERLWTFANIRPEDRELVLAWLTAAYRPKGPYCVLVLQGGQGTAKSTTGRAIRGLIDPNRAALRAEPRDPRDLMIAARNSWVIGFDNLSTVRPWLSDSICRLATGGGFSTRELFSDADEVLIDAQRPTILNGIDDLVDRGDLLERSLLLALPPIEETKRRTESDLWAEYDREAGDILGALFDIVCRALRELPDVQLDRLPRMADFALWGTAVERALKWETGTFERAYARNREAGHGIVFESEPLGPALLEWFGEKSAWEGTAQELLDALTASVAESLRQSKRWPQSARALSGRMRRVAPTLAGHGFEVEFVRQARARLIAIRRSPGFVRQDRHNRHDRHMDGANASPTRPYDNDGRNDGSDDRHSTVTRPSLSKDAAEPSLTKTHDGHDGCDGSAGDSQGRDDDCDPTDESPEGRLLAVLGRDPGPLKADDLFFAAGFRRQKSNASNGSEWDSATDALLNLFGRGVVEKVAGPDAVPLWCKSDGSDRQR